METYLPSQIDSLPGRPNIPSNGITTPHQPPRPAPQHLHTSQALIQGNDFSWGTAMLGGTLEALGYCVCSWTWCMVLGCSSNGVPPQYRHSSPGRLGPNSNSETQHPSLTTPWAKTQKPHKLMEGHRLLFTHPSISQLPLWFARGHVTNSGQ